MTKRAFGELESQILFILKSDKRKTVRDVHKALGGTDNYNTVMTVMTRLTEKKKLARERVGSHYEYWILPSSNPAALLTMLKQKFFGETTRLLVSHLIENAEDLSDEDLAAMEKLLQKTRGEKK